MSRFLLTILLLIIIFSNSFAGESFTLKSAVDYAVKNSPYLKYLEANAKVNKGDKFLAKSKLMPVAELNLNYTKFQKAHAVVLGVEPKRLQFDDDKYYGGLRFNYVLWDFKSRRYNYLSEKEKLKGAIENFEREKEKFVFNVINIYLKNLNIKHDINASNEMFKSVKALYEKIKKEVEIGRKPLVDELKIKVTLSKVKDDISKLNVLKRELYLSLAQLMGIDSNNFKLTEINDKFFEKNKFNKDEIIKFAYQNRKDLKAIEKNIKAIELRLKSIKNSYLPEISINSEINEQAGDDKTFKGNSFVGLNLKMPVFDGGYRKGNIEKLKYQLISLTQLKENKKLEIRKDIETALENYKAAKIRLENAVDTVKKAEEVLKIEKLKYSLGRTTIDFLLDAEASLLTAKSYYYKALYDKILAFFNIKLAAGKLFW